MPARTGSVAPIRLRWVFVGAAIFLVALVYSLRFLPELERPVLGARISPRVVASLRHEGLVGEDEPVLALFSPDYPDVSQNVKGITKDGVFDRVRRGGQEDRGVRTWSEIRTIEVFDEASRGCTFNFTLHCMLGGDTYVVLNRGTPTELVLDLSGAHASEPFIHALFSEWTASRGGALMHGR